MSGPRCFADYYTAMEQGFPIFSYSSPASFTHLAYFFLMVIAMPLHIYLATAASPGTFRIMTRGDVPLNFARKKYAKWVKEEGLE